MGSNYIQHVSQRSTTEIIVPQAGYTGATDVIVDVRCMKTKSFLIQNTGIDSITYQLLGSMDEEVFDIIDTAETTLATVLQVLVTSTGNYTHMKLRVKANGESVLGTSVTVKVVLSTN